MAEVETAGAEAAIELAAAEVTDRGKAAQLQTRTLAEALLSLACRRLEGRQCLDARPLSHRRRSSSVPSASPSASLSARTLAPTGEGAGVTAALRRLCLARAWETDVCSATPDAAAVIEALLSLLAGEEALALPLATAAAHAYPHSAVAAAALSVVLALEGCWLKATAAGQRHLLLAGPVGGVGPAAGAAAHLRIGALFASNGRSRAANEHFTAAWEQRPDDRVAQLHVLRQKRDLAARRLREEKAAELSKRVAGGALRQRMGQAEALQEQSLPEPSTALTEFFSRWKAGGEDSDTPTSVWSAVGSRSIAGGGGGGGGGGEEAEGEKGSTLYNRLLSNASKAGRARAKPERRREKPSTSSAPVGACRHTALQAPPGLLPLLEQQLAPRGLLSAVRTWLAPSEVSLGPLPRNDDIDEEWATATGGARGHNEAACSPFFCGDRVEAGEECARPQAQAEASCSAWLAASRQGLAVAAVAELAACQLPRPAAEAAAAEAAHAFASETQSLLAAAPQSLVDLERVLVAGMEQAHGALVRAGLAAGRGVQASLLGGLLLPAEEAGAWWFLCASSGTCQALHVAAASRQVSLVDEADAASQAGALGVSDAALARALALARASASAADDGATLTPAHSHAESDASSTKSSAVAAAETAAAAAAAAAGGERGGGGGGGGAAVAGVSLTEEEQARVRRVRLVARLVRDGDLLLLASEGLAEGFRPQALGLELRELLGQAGVDAASMQAEAASRRFAGAAMEQALRRLPAATPHRAAQALLGCLRATRLPQARPAALLALRAGLHHRRHLATADLWDHARGAAALARLGDEQLQWLPARALPALHAACPLQATVLLTAARVLLYCRPPARCRLVCAADEHNAHLTALPPLTLLEDAPCTRSAGPSDTAQQSELRRPIARSVALPCEVLVASMQVQQLAGGTFLFSFARVSPT